MAARDTIAAVATPPGRGGVGIVRISGANCPQIAESLIGSLPPPRVAKLVDFTDQQQQLIDQGIALYFPAPHSFTGEDVLELQGHGGPLVMDLLLQAALQAGARVAHAGEFSERAFLNDKLDLVQAEAIADLIDAQSHAAARLASRTLQGHFSQRIHTLVEQLIELRLYVEAAIDFPEEEIDFLNDGHVSERLLSIMSLVEKTFQSAQSGRVLRDGLTLVIAGRPNAGKSSLLNALAGSESAIVTEIPGTTRDLLKERITIEGIPLHIIDTAGLRESDDPIEAEGVRRAREQMAEADRVLWVFDDRSDPDPMALDRSTLPEGVPVTLIRNKIDLTGKSPGLHQIEDGVEICLSAKQGEGMSLLNDHLKQCAGYHDQHEGEFIARRRHLDALQRGMQYLEHGQQSLLRDQAGELLAEDLRVAQFALSEITGEFTADDLLGRIFSSFCIGK
ncbi:MAG: tRNA uridine-5-carboxymethylaminomethyl(34) synthesis GTPase MnmE [Candidatus Thiodiazotropha lotti]|uniref:tRNA uridine-5-carboxymethylaminomethyl(34) synthesis GTPase MnmE n=1 Tax=Candidatus Thiodiazotropha endoloripes TaxID=1818881 RepID=UPI00083DE40C|nr:tRNA uridine-5-carboxymethylaminomethyl(34) synthesis GTPase MnmE [Candidatus Thiodiazotropha endoloripes]MCG7902288.1 tRNA uridine-5-carboxymethylaminomethyl(34) synthesis GTPase MnmE [Candidatus Thiodiazotropha weberae]MCG7991469.1 tRNA uridine-5-carboxymethylaminomethyl(34) synthesis GTPase MnmE [Candidatus Thiodiazotropha lotti]MCG7912658.1 tRNA uridine-5-carboxymethylaminomethyl(34) synthesis GTPase MnmE [Candidatus Thiodiazotropha weberae]MCG8000950.1 tRNA uridine-5-carboxymethylaminom